MKRAMVYGNEKESISVNIAAGRSQSDLVQNLESFRVRPHGFSLKLDKLPLLSRLSPPQQLLAALLRGDAEGSANLIDVYQSESTFFSTFITFITNVSFARLTLDRLFDLALVQRLPHQAKAELLSAATKETVTHELGQERFLQIAKGLAHLETKLIWIKGVAVSLTHYSSPCHRLFGDLDLVVHPSAVTEALASLAALGFSWVEDPGFSNQYGVGPMQSVSEVFLTPDPEWIPCSAVALQKVSWPLIDVKVDPFDTGLQMLEINRFFAEAVANKVGGQTFRVPSVVDQLMIAVQTLMKDRFTSWRTLYDVHILADKVSDSDAWEVFVTYCEREGIQAAAWSSLILAADRFGTPVPYAVFERLHQDNNLLRRLTTFVVSPSFIWNATSFPMMVLSACVSQTSRVRKLRLLARAFLPSHNFLSAYYNRGRKLSAGQLPLILMVHWFVLVMPGGITRRTIGRFLWPMKPRIPDLDSLGDGNGRTLNRQEVEQLLGPMTKKRF